MHPLCAKKQVCKIPSKFIERTFNSLKYKIIQLESARAKSDSYKVYYGRKDIQQYVKKLSDERWMDLKRFIETGEFN